MPCAPVVALPGLLEAAEVTLLEASPTLQTNAVGNSGRATTLHGLQQVEALPDQPLYLIANEFFDALPIRQFLREGIGWRERQVGLAEDKLAVRFGPIATATRACSGLHPKDAAEGDMVEVCAAAAPIMDVISERIAGHGGMALIIDYGDWGLSGDTFQAVRAHKTVSPLATPGTGRPDRPC